MGEENVFSVWYSTQSIDCMYEFDSDIRYIQEIIIF